MQIIRNTVFVFLLGLFICICGCQRVDVNPKPIFQEISNNISKLTGESVYWDSVLKDKIVPVSVEKILASELTEKEMVKIALLNNKNLQAVYESLGIAQAQLTQAGLLKNPIFSFSYRFTTQSNITDLIDGSFIQNFLEILLIPLKTKMAQAELEAIKTTVLVQILRVVAETKIALYSLQATKLIGDFKKQILLAKELSYEAALRLLDAGNITDLEVLQKHSSYEQAKLELASWEIAILEGREELNILMGLWGRQINWKFSSKLPEVPLKEKNFKNIENNAIANSMDLRILYKKLESVVSSLGLDTAKLMFPQIDSGISAEREDSIWYVGPALSMALPLFDFGKANSAKAQSKISQKWSQYTALAVEIRSKARSLRFSLLNAFRQSQFLEKIMVPLAEKVTTQTLYQHNAMQLSVFQLLEAKQMEIEKKIQEVEKKKEYFIAKVELQTLLQGHDLGKKPIEYQRRLYD